jgi:hypothetical protein
LRIKCNNEQKDDVVIGSPRTAIRLTSSGGGLLLSTAAGLGAALVSAVIWMVVVQVTGYEVGIVAVGIGFLVGLAMASTAGTSRALAPIAAVLSLLGCVLGQALTDAHFVAQGAGVSTIFALRHMIADPGGLGWDVFRAGFGPIDVLFWAIAGVQGFRLTARAVAENRAVAARPEFVPQEFGRRAAAWPADYLPPADTPVTPGAAAVPGETDSVPADSAAEVAAGLAETDAAPAGTGDAPVAPAETAALPAETTAPPAETAAPPAETAAPSAGTATDSAETAIGASETASVPVEAAAETPAEALAETPAEVTPVPAPVATPAGAPA